MVLKEQNDQAVRFSYSGNGKQFPTVPGICSSGYFYFLARMTSDQALASAFRKVDNFFGAVQHCCSCCGSEMDPEDVDVLRCPQKPICEKCGDTYYNDSQRHYFSRYG